MHQPVMAAGDTDNDEPGTFESTDGFLSRDRW